MSALKLIVANAPHRITSTGVARLVAALGGGLAAAYVAATVDPLIAMALAGGLVLVLLSIRWPLLPLFVFVALIPIEETLDVTGFGTLSRWAGLLFAGVYALPRLGRLVPGALPPVAWAYVGWAVLSVAWALDPGTAQLQLQTLVQLVVIGFLVADVVIRDARVVRPLLWTYSVAASATAAIGVGLYLFTGAGGDSRIAAISNQNPAQFATLLLPALIFGLHELLEGRRPAASSVVALLCATGIILSGTRSVWLAATIVILVLVIPRLGLRRGVVAVGVVGAIVVAALQLPGVGGLVAERTETAVVTGGAGRTDIWAVGFEIISASPIVGAGYANFPVAFDSAVIRSANVTQDVGAGRAPHNLVIGTLGELGIVGLILLALFLGPLVARRGWGPDGLVVQAILASLLIDALFLDIISNRKQVWVVIGLAAGLAYLARRAEQSSSAWSARGEGDATWLPPDGGKRAAGARSGGETRVSGQPGRA